MSVTQRRISLIFAASAIIAGAFALGRASSEELVPAASLAPAPAASPALLPAASQAPPVPASGVPDFRTVAARVIPSVVTVRSERTVTVSERGAPFFGTPFDDDLFGRFFGPQGQGRPEPREYRQNGLGSGVVVSAEGYILTNNHVVEGSDSVEVVVDERDTYKAKVLGTDPQTDVAVLKVEEAKLTPIEMGDSDDLEVGEWVLAVGNPFSEALGHTVTAGIVSAKGRSNLQLASYEDFIQTDAAINPGNSGGALVNSRGQLVGINTAIISRSGGYQGIGFSIPVNMARNVMDQLVHDGKVTRGFLGVSIQDLTPEIAEGLGIPDRRGAIVSEVQKGGPGDDAGLRRGDVIVGYDGGKIGSSFELRNRVAETSPGKTVTLAILRGESEERVKVSLAERPDDHAAAGPAGGSPSAGEDLGLSVRPLTPDLAERLGYRNEEGVVVDGVRQGGHAQEAGLQRGDLIMEVNRRPVASVEECEAALAKVGEGQVALLLVRRDEGTFYVTLRR